MEWKPIADANRDERVLGGWYSPQRYGPPTWHWGPARFNVFNGSWYGERGGDPSHYLPLPEPPPVPTRAVPEAPQAVAPDATVDWDGDVVNPPVAVD